MHTDRPQICKGRPSLRRGSSAVMGPMHPNEKFHYFPMWEPEAKSRLPWTYSCVECGALVEGQNMDKHAEWHERLKAVLEPRKEAS